MAENSIPAEVFRQAVGAVRFLRTRLCSILIGQDNAVTEVLAALIAGGHVLLEGVPGTGKTLLVRALAQSFSGQFNRIQFTPDLMPSDVTGSYWFNNKTRDFELRRGPVFTHLLLADEINRAPAKTQAALLQVMQEKTVTLDGTTHNIPRPFMVLATQNPIEQEGTYPLPEAQLDRFMFKTVIGYPDYHDEVKLVEAVVGAQNNDLLSAYAPEKTLSPAVIARVQQIAAQIHADAQVIDYAVRLVHATRRHPDLSAGASVRAGIALIGGARALALMDNRTFITPDDVKSLWQTTLRHRVRLSVAAEMEGLDIDGVLAQIAAGVEAPRH